MNTLYFYGLSIFTFQVSPEIKAMLLFYVDNRNRLKMSIVRLLQIISFPNSKYEIKQTGMSVLLL
jgi:hypothetical protein